MGNLRQKYTEEEWEEMGEKIKKEKDYTPNYIKEMINYLKNEKQTLLIQQIKEIVKSTPNDQELGEKIRKLF